MPHLSSYVRLADHSEQTLADFFRVVAEGHASVADVFHTCHQLAGFSDTHRDGLVPFLDRYGAPPHDDVDEPERLRTAGPTGSRQGEVGLLRDLQDLHLLADLVQTTWTVIAQGAQGLRDRELLDHATTSRADTARQLTWLDTRIKAAAPQALIVTPRPHREGILPLASSGDERE